MSVHLLNALETGSKINVVNTVDTDTVVILIGQFFQLIERFPGLNLWVVFGTGKNFVHYQHITCLANSPCLQWLSN